MFLQIFLKEFLADLLTDFCHISMKDFFWKFLDRLLDRFFAIFLYRCFATFDNLPRLDVTNYSKVKRSKSSDSSWMLPAGSTWNEELWRKSSLLAACIPQAEATSDQWFSIILVLLPFYQGFLNLSAQKICRIWFFLPQGKIDFDFLYCWKKVFLQQIQNFL